MKTQQYCYKNNQWHTLIHDSLLDNNQAQLVLIFGHSKIINEPQIFTFLRITFPNAQLVFCSSSGEIYHNSMHENSIIATAVQFSKTRLKVVETDISAYESSLQAGLCLSQKLLNPTPNFVFIVSDGRLVNGSELVIGLNKGFDNKVGISGGLASDDAKFEATFVGLNAIPTEGKIVAIGFYGDSLQFGYGSVGGWDMFGPERLVTKSQSNVLYELDDKNALSLYKEYLGIYAKDLPSSAFLFPLSVKHVNSDHEIVRTVIGINEENQSMTFAGDIPEGSTVRLMRTNFDRVIDGAMLAAQHSMSSFHKEIPHLALLVSCLGRKIILGQRTDEEVEVVVDILGKNTVIAGFYSNGEIAPFHNNTFCELHNQTMTITTLTEV